MAYTVRNYKNGKAVKDAFKAGTSIAVFQPGPFGPDVKDGQVCIEGPHYPEPHRFYLSATVKDGVITAIRR